MKLLHATRMKQIAVIFSLNVASILSAITTLYETPTTHIDWKIENFFDLPKEKDYCFDSPTFSLANNTLSLQMCPNGETERESDGYIGIYLTNKSSAGHYPIDFRIGSKSFDGNEYLTTIFHKRFYKNDRRMGWSSLIKRSDLLRSKDTLVPQGTLTVFCKARVVNSIEVIPRFIPLSELDSSQNASICNQSNLIINESLPLCRTACNTTQGTETLSANLKEMYASKRFTDVTIIVKNNSNDKSKEFSAHKVILSYRLPAFDSMLENNPDKIEITDCDPGTFEEFLRFIYTGKLVETSHKKAMSLYMTADKFNMFELKEECARYIAKQDLNIDSFYHILRFANLYSDSMLLMATTEFFITNAKLLLVTEKWEKFHADDPIQGNKLLLAYVEKKDQYC